MAVKLDTSSQSIDWKAEDAAKTKKIFKIIIITLCSLIGVVILWTIVGPNGIISRTKKINQISVNYAAEESQYNAYLAEHPRSSDGAPEASETEPGETTSTREVAMISAKTVGERICELQTAYYTNGTLNDADMNELATLTSNTGKSLWFGQSVNAVRNPIVWEFLTPYDSTEIESYPVLFGCYTADHEFLLVTVTARYYAASNTIQFPSGVDSAMEYTDFGYMLATNGSIRSDGTSSPDSQSITGMTGELTGNNQATPTDPSATQTTPAVAADVGDDVDATEPAQTEPTTTCEPTETTQQGVNDVTFGG